MRRTNRKRRGFTLIEILIVVVILGILAAIVVPQFTNASQEATASSIRSQLQTLRGQIELYRVRNSGNLPASFDDLLNPPNGEAPYLTQEPVPPSTAWAYVFGDNANTADVTEVIHVTCSALPDGITQADIDSW